jgi:hypothetical protein
VNYAHAAFFDFREATKDLVALSESQQVHALKGQLFQALERASDFQSRSRRVEEQIDHLKSQAAARIREQQAFAAQIHSELVATQHELADTRIGGQREVAALRGELLSKDRLCQGLTEIVRALLLTIEQAALADADAEEGATPPGAVGVRA